MICIFVQHRGSVKGMPQAAHLEAGKTAGLGDVGGAVEDGAGDADEGVRHWAPVREPERLEGTWGRHQSQTVCREQTGCSKTLMLE